MLSMASCILYSLAVPCLQLIVFLLVWEFSFIETKFDLSQKPVIFGSSGNRYAYGSCVVFFSPNVLALGQFQIWLMKKWSGLVQILHTKQPYLGSLKIKKYRKSILHFWGGGVGRRCAIGSWEHLKWEGTQFSVMTMMCFVSRHNHTHGDVCHVAQKTFAAISRKNAFICNDPHNNNRTC